MKPIIIQFPVCNSNDLNTIKILATYSLYEYLYLMKSFLNCLPMLKQAMRHLHRIISGHFMSIKSVCKIGMTPAFRLQRANYWCCITVSAMFLCWGRWFILSNSDRWRNVDPSCLNTHQQPNWMHESNRQSMMWKGKDEATPKKS